MPGSETRKPIGAIRCRKPKQIIAEQNKQAERDLAQRQAQSVAVVKQPLPPSTGDGWDDTAAEAEARLIRGSLLKFADWKWSIGKEAIEVKEGRRLVAVATAAAWVKWQENKPVEYRLRESGGPSPGP